jgi:hypothetical protein
MNKLLSLKVLLFSLSIAVLVYTIFAFQKEGTVLFQLFFSNITSLNWNGQFNLDFSCYLTLSGFWIMWRNKFSSTSIVFGVVAMILGIVVFAPYILYLLKKENKDLEKVFIGNR